MIPRVGDQVAGYRLDAFVGRGGGGVVFRATHLRLDRTVALKLLVTGPAIDDSFRRRFEREARTAAALEHPHIVPVYDADEADGLLYLAMRFIEGPDLATLIHDGGPLGPYRTCAILGQVAHALDVAHGAGLVHLDVKPGNILLASPTYGKPDHAYLSDFGLTRRLEGAVTGGLVAGTGRRRLRAGLHCLHLPVRLASLRRDERRGDAGRTPVRAVTEDQRQGNRGAGRGRRCVGAGDGQESR